MNLDNILEEVAKGKLDPSHAKSQIKKLYEEKVNKVTSESEDGKTSELQGKGERIKGALSRLKKTVHLDELLKMSSGVVNQITENVPRTLEKLPTQFTQNLNTFAFSSHNAGIESKLSIFRAVSTSPTSEITDNQVIGSQWFGIQINDNTQVRSNRFTAVQFSEVSLTNAILAKNTLSLSRLSNATIQDATFESNKMGRSLFSDVSITESQFSSNDLIKSEFAQTVLNATKMQNNSFDGVDIRDCEFDSCELQGIEFENCKFHECTFSQVKIVSPEKVRLANLSFTGKMVSGCTTVAAFLAALQDDSVQTVAPQAESIQTAAAETAAPVEPQQGAVDAEVSQPQQSPAPAKSRAKSQKRAEPEATV